jgi:hypothetical protein
MLDVVMLEREARGGQYQVDSGADPEDNDSDSDSDSNNDVALLFSAGEIVDHSCSRRDTAEVDHQELARTSHQTEEDLARENTRNDH